MSADTGSHRARRYLLFVVFVAALAALNFSCDEAGAGGGTDSTPDDGEPGVVRPSAFFVVTPNPNTGYVTIFEELVFDAGGSDSNVPGRPIVGYRWDFYYEYAEGFDPQRTRTDAVTAHTFKRFEEDGFAVGLVVIDAEGEESELFVRNLWIEDREGGILVVE